MGSGVGGEFISKALILVSGFFHFLTPIHARMCCCISAVGIATELQRVPKTDCWGVRRCLAGAGEKEIVEC